MAGKMTMSFNILEKEMTPSEIKSKVKIFTRFINQHIKVLAGQNNLPGEISTYWARHTFATMSVNKGASLEFMREALGHTDLKTTQTYFAGFTDETKNNLRTHCSIFSKHDLLI
jgi:integrase/recombinase XerD